MPWCEQYQHECELAQIDTNAFCEYDVDECNRDFEEDIDISDLP
jgi:hypothetical protein